MIQCCRTCSSEDYRFRGWIAECESARNFDPWKLRRLAVDRRLNPWPKPSRWLYLLLSDFSMFEFAAVQADVIASRPS